MNKPTIREMAEQLHSNQLHARHRTYQETIYWCRQWRLLAEQAVAGMQAVAAQTREQDAQIVPTSWLDGLLTGPNAVIGSPPYGCQDIERLLRAIKAAIRSAAEGER